MPMAKIRSFRNQNLTHKVSGRSGDKGIARTQSPTNKNYALELPTFGVIVGVNPTVVQWKGLTLEEPPSWSWLTSAPGKYARAGSVTSPVSDTIRQSIDTTYTARWTFGHTASHIVPRVRQPLRPWWHPGATTVATVLFALRVWPAL